MNFGEILEPSSRAFWNEYEEPEDSGSIKVELEFQDELGFCKDFEKFVVIEGSNILEFLKATLLKNRRPMCRVKNSLVSLYHFEEIKTIICVSEENDLNLGGSIAELLVPWLEIAKFTITLSIQPKILYKGKEWDDMQNPTFIRGMNSTVENVKELETPNFITGVSAGVASWRNFKNMDISCYLAYIDSPTLDTLSTEPILKLLNDLRVPCERKYIMKTKDHSHVYM